MLFGLYLGSTAYVWYSTIKDHVEMDKRLKEEGYVFTVKKFDKNDIPILAVSALAMSLPLFNLVIPLSTMDKEQAYDEYKNRLLEAGSIEKDESREQKKRETIKNDKINNSINTPRNFYTPENKFEDTDTIDHNSHILKKDFFRNKR